MFKKVLLTILIVILAAIFWFSIPPKLEVTQEHECTHRSSYDKKIYPAICGTLKNNSISIAINPAVFYSFYDSEGNVVDVAIGYGDSGVLPPYREAEFAAPNYSGKPYANYEKSFVEADSTASAYIKLGRPYKPKPSKNLELTEFKCEPNYISGKIKNNGSEIARNIWVRNKEYLGHLDLLAPGKTWAFEHKPKKPIHDCSEPVIELH